MSALCQNEPSVHHVAGFCISVVLWYGRKRANIHCNPVSGLRAAVLNVVDVFSTESRRRTAVSQQFVGYKTARSFEDTIVQENIRGNRLGSLTIESGAKVVIERQSTENS